MTCEAILYTQASKHQQHYYTAVARETSNQRCVTAHTMQNAYQLCKTPDIATYAMTQTKHNKSVTRHYSRATSPSRVRSHSRAFIQLTAFIIIPRASWGRRLHFYKSVLLSRTHCNTGPMFAPHCASIKIIRRVINFNFSPNLALFQHVSRMQQRMFSQAAPFRVRMA